MTQFGELLGKAMTFEGCIGAAVIHCEDGSEIGSVSQRRDFDPAGAALSYLEVFKARLSASQCLETIESKEDVFALKSQYHILRFLPEECCLFFVALDRGTTDLSIALRKVAHLLDFFLNRGVGSHR